LNSVGVMTTRSTGNGAIDCAIYRSQFVNPSPGLTVVDLNQLSSAIQVPFEMMTSGTYSLRMRRDATSYTCNSSRAAASQVVSGTFMLANMPYTGGLYVTGAAARYQWFMMVNNP
jgi:hypothetical protein